MLFLICLTLYSANSTAQDQETAPRIISTIPEFGDCRVDPELKEIIIIFDQDMSLGMSLLNTKNMPEINGQARWINQRTFSIPVNLSPNRLYSIKFNNWKYQDFRNFRSILGVPLNPEELYFHTKTISSEAINKKAFQELRNIFPSQYSYAAIRGINWKTLLDKNQTAFENSKSTIEFTLKLLKLLRNAKDPHLWIEAEGQRFNTSTMNAISINYNTNEILKILTNRKESEMSVVVSGEYNNVGYICIKNWNNNNTESILTSVDRLIELRDKPNIILDVRENSGGDESIAEEFASYFVTDSIPYEKVICYNEKTGEFDLEYLKMIYPNDQDFRYSGNIYVLSGPGVISSNESFIMMMKQVPNAKVIGMKTYGSSGNPIPHKLSNGVIVFVPSWQAYTIEGKMIEGHGVDPDIEIITREEDFENTDILFEKVLNIIADGN